MSWTDPRGDIEALLPQLRQIRRDIHKHPELGFEEIRTQALCRAWLEARGYAPRVCAETGLIADLDPEARGPVIALRADLDCLPMHEPTDIAHRSVHPGKAHKCGHDGHTAILLGVADLLARYRGEVGGNVRLLFQPAEEGVRGGGATSLPGATGATKMSMPPSLMSMRGAPATIERMISAPNMRW